MSTWEMTLYIKHTLVVRNRVRVNQTWRGIDDVGVAMSGW